MVHFHSFLVQVSSVFLLWNTCQVDAFSSSFSIKNELQVTSRLSTALSMEPKRSTRKLSFLYSESLQGSQEIPTTDNQVPLSTLPGSTPTQNIVFQAGLAIATTAAITHKLDLTPELQLLRDNVLTGTVIFTLGDYAAQILTHLQTNTALEQSSNDNFGKGFDSLPSFQVDENRFLISTFLGVVWAGIVNPSVYAGVEELLPGVSFQLVIAKMLITCSILSTGGNFTTMMIRRFLKQCLEKDDSVTYSAIFQDCVESCKRDMVEVIQDDLKLFLAYDLLCYSVIPPSVRPLTNALIASAWAMYMSIASAKEVNISVEVEGKEMQ